MWIQRLQREWRIAHEPGGDPLDSSLEVRVIFERLGDSGLEFQFSVWGTKGNYLELRNSRYAGIKNAFDRHGIEIPFPHRTLYAGGATEPLPVRLVADSPSQPRG